MSTSARCGKCGEARSLAEVNKPPPRLPCPKCGADVIAFSVEFSETVTTSDVALVSELKPAPADSWRDRFTRLQIELAGLSAPRTLPLSGATIYSEADKVRKLFVSAYHLKDAIKNEYCTTKKEEDEIERAISAEPSLALLADLANLDKHNVLSNPPRSGVVPKFGHPSGTSSSGSIGWKLSFPVEHGKSRYDAIDLATDALKAWERELRRLKIL